MSDEYEPEQLLDSEERNHLEDWRQTTYTFSDETGRIFTVTNTPLMFRLPTSELPDPNPEENMSLQEILHPHFPTRAVPEIPFVVRSLPLDDALLSRLAVNPTSLQPIRYGDRWGLARDIRDSWQRLETTLYFISDLLLFFAHGEGHCDREIYKALAKRSHWSAPQDSGYHRTHPLYPSAVYAIRQAHLALTLLAARLSLAVAVWLYAEGRTDGVPHWITFLINKGVPSSLIDILQQSVITRFDFGLRVGVVMDGTDTIWTPLVSVLDHARVPIFTLWKNPEHISWFSSQYPALCHLLPTSSSIQMAHERPPTANVPRLFSLVSQFDVRLHPDTSIATGEAPSGPYQYPNESREAFFNRHKAMEPTLRRGETSAALTRRQERLAHSESGAVPKSRTKVFAWTLVKYVYTDAPFRWMDSPYRLPIRTSAVRGLWQVYLPAFRKYNPFFDEWDLWLPDEEWDNMASSSSVLIGSAAPVPVLLPTPIIEQLHPPLIAHGDPSENDDQTNYETTTTISTSPAHYLSADIQHAIQEELRSLYPTFNNRPEVGVGFSWEYLLLWFGVHLTPTSEPGPEVDVSLYKDRLWTHFGEERERMPSKESLYRTLSGWVWAVREGKWDVPLMGNVWDLDIRSTWILPLLSHLQEHIRVVMVQKRQGECPALFLLRYKNDMEKSRWTLAIDAMTLAFLTRHQHVTNSASAANLLLKRGIPFHTIIRHASSLQKQHSFFPAASEPSQYRRYDHIPTSDEYGEYMYRVLDLLHRPSVMRAALLTGGIVWRIMLEAIGRDEDLYQMYLQLGAAGPTETGGGKSGRVFAFPNGDIATDDVLSEADADVICGVYKVYTGSGFQTEDRSWWPKDTHWKTAPCYNGIWTPYNEEWFTQRQEKIFSREPGSGPRNGKDWKNILRIWKQPSKVYHPLLIASEDFVCNYTAKDNL